MERGSARLQTLGDIKIQHLNLVDEIPSLGRVKFKYFDVEARQHRKLKIESARLGDLQSLWGQWGAMSGLDRISHP